MPVSTECAAALLSFRHPSINSKQRKAKNGPFWNSIINWERLRNHIPNTNILAPSLNHSSAHGDTPRLRGLDNNMSWFTLSKAFDMSINTNIEIFFSSIAFNRSSVANRRAVSVEWCLWLPLWNCDSLLLSSKNLINCLWAKLSLSLDNTWVSSIAIFRNTGHFSNFPHACECIRFKGIVHQGCDYMQSSW